ncbi:MAG TPA: aspartate--tRNA ligase, partial [Treponema sp.]|nr:aspartate--tRNA ligase [Treponema sp.]
MNRMKRTDTCGSLRGTDAGKKVILNGWVFRKRDHGGITFINLRDRYGITQAFVEPDSPQELLDIAQSLRMESCIALEG